MHRQYPASALPSSPGPACLRCAHAAPARCGAWQGAGEWGRQRPWPAPVHSSAGAPRRTRWRTAKPPGHAPAPAGRHAAWPSSSSRTWRPGHRAPAPPASRWPLRNAARRWRCRECPACAQGHRSTRHCAGHRPAISAPAAATNHGCPLAHPLAAPAPDARCRVSGRGRRQK